MEAKSGALKTVTATVDESADVAAVEAVGRSMDDSNEYNAATAMVVAIVVLLCWSWVVVVVGGNSSGIFGMLMHPLFSEISGTNVENLGKFQISQKVFQMWKHFRSLKKVFDLRTNVEILRSR